MNREIRFERRRSAGSGQVGGVLSEKGHVDNKIAVPYTDTGGQAEYAKASESNPVKELGNLTP